jgi:hypothetical protein
MYPETKHLRPDRYVAPAEITETMETIETIALETLEI